MEETYLNDNPRLRMSLGEDLSTATELKFYIRKPDATEIIRSCVAENLVTGILYYDVVDGDAFIVGTYHIQCRAVFAGQKYKSKTLRFKVLDAYE